MQSTDTSRGTENSLEERREEMKGYLTNNGYMGWVGNKYMLFPTEQEYIEYMEES